MEKETAIAVVQEVHEAQIVIQETEPTNDQTENRVDDSMEVNNNETDSSYPTPKDEDEQNLMLDPDVHVHSKSYERSENRIQRLSIATIRSIEKIRGVNCRTVLWYVAFVGFMVNYMYRVNINIAIVEMIAIRTSGIANNHISECLQSFSNQTNSSSSLSNDISDSVHSTKFAWNELDQSRVLGSFFWLHWVLQIPGGMLAPRFGTKTIFGLSNFVSCFICFFIPMAAKMHVNYLIILRILQGLISGLAWPAMHHLTAQWIPPNERSKFLTSYLGSSVGIAVCYPLFGFIISILGWESVFYMSGILGTLWYAAWLYFVYDSPAKHPRIDRSERLYIEESLNETLHTGKRIIPWTSILTSWPVWVNIIGQFGGIWGLFTLMTQAPTYFRVIHGWNVQKIGLLNGMPHICRMGFAYVFSILVDYLLKKKVYSRTTIRKLAGGTATLLNGAFVLGLAYSGCNSAAAIVFATIASSMHGAVSSGQLASLIDMSPNYSGVLLGLNGMVGVSPGFISPYIVGILTFGNQSAQQWQYVFLTCSAMLFICGTIYVVFADSTLQSWNQPKTTIDSTKDKEMQIIRNEAPTFLVPLKESDEC